MKRTGLKKNRLEKNRINNRQKKPVGQNIKNRFRFFSSVELVNRFFIATLGSSLALAFGLKKAQLGVHKSGFFKAGLGLFASNIPTWSGF